MSITNLNFDDLENNKEFLRGLRNREFILVLGAGFSYGIGNKCNDDLFPVLNGYDYPTIPIVSSFLEYTNALFGGDHKLYEDAANVWAKQCEDDPRLFEKFRSMFMVNEENLDVSLYKSIFIPKWHNVFTLNFDNVLSKLEPHDYEILYYPQHTGRQKPSLLHAHGYIEAINNIYEDIVFSARQYTKLNHAGHDLYDVLHGDVRNGKNLIIVGTQFREPVIRNKFFDGLEDFTDTQIFHFDIDNNIARNSPDFHEKDYNFIKLEDSALLETGDTKNGFGTRVFLRFLKQNKSKIFELAYSGVRTINQSFKNKTLEKGQRNEYSPADFYLGNRNDEYQWYGILNDWDILRNDYPELKDRIVNSFLERSHLNVVSLVIGSGGVGKSTLLRRLAVDCVDEDFVVIWIDDSNIADFVNFRLYQHIPNDIPYLFILEDWYRIKQLLPETDQKLLLQSLNSFSNSRICIGDRFEDPNVIAFLRGGAELAIYAISYVENKQIISTLAERLPAVQQAAHQLELASDESLYNCSLFIILFTIFRLTEEGAFSEVEYSNIEQEFRQIISSDLRQLSQIHLGAARFLVIFSTLYKTRKFGLASNLLLNLYAELDPQKRRIIPSEAKKILKRYLSEIEGAEENGVLGFNQDVLAELGLSRPIVGKSLEEQFQLDPNILVDLLHFLSSRTDEGASDLTMSILLEIGVDEFQFQDLFEITKMTFHGGNHGNHLGFLLRHNDCQKNRIELEEFSKKIVISYLEGGNQNFRGAVVSHHKNLRKPALVSLSRRILEHKSLAKLQHHLVVAAFKHSDDNELKQAAAAKILEDDSLATLQDHLVVVAFKHSDDDDLKQAVAAKILEDNGLVELSPKIIGAAFLNSYEYDVKIAALRRLIEKYGSFSKINQYIRARCLIAFGDSHCSENTPRQVADFVIGAINAYVAKEKMGEIGLTQVVRQYFEIMKISFQSVDLWKRRSMYIIKNWKSQSRSNITGILLAYRDNSNETKRVCEEILLAWRSEVAKKVVIPGSRLDRYGDHVKISLEHPELNELAKCVANDILHEMETEKNIPAYFERICKRILDENDIPRPPDGAVSLMRTSLRFP